MNKDRNKPPVGRKTRSPPRKYGLSPGVMVGTIFFSEADWDELERLAKLRIGADARRAVTDAALDFVLKLSRGQNMPSVKALQRRLQKLSAATMQLRAELLGDATRELGSAEWHVAGLVLNGHIDSGGDGPGVGAPESWSRVLQQIETALEWAGNRLEQETVIVRGGPMGGREIDELLEALAKVFRDCGGRVTLGTRRPSQGGEYKASAYCDFAHRVIEFTAAQVESKRRGTTLPIAEIRPMTRAAVGARVFGLRMTGRTSGGGK